MAKFSYATERKIKIIEEKVGDNWREKFKGESIDSIYNRLVGDDRKNLFCKVSPKTKEELDEMLSDYGVTLGEFMETLIGKEFRRYQDSKSEQIQTLLKEFSG